MPVGKDAEGNPVPIAPRPLQELYGRVGNAISSALQPITGLSPVEVFNSVGSMERNIYSVMEQQTRSAHPDWDQMQVQRYINDEFTNHGGEAYQSAYRTVANMPYMGTEQIGPVPIPSIVQGLGRMASPVRVYNWPEQVKLDSWEGLQPSGAIPPRNIPHLDEIDPATGELTPAGEQAKFVLSAAKYGAAASPEMRALTEAQNEFYQLTSPELQAAGSLASSLGRVPYGEGPLEPVTVGGVEYTPEMLAGMSKGDLYDLGTQALMDAGYTREDRQAAYDAEARFLADNPDYAQYREYKSLVEQNPQQFVEQTSLTNPGFAQFTRSSLMDHQTGEIDYDAAKYPDAYLASQGVRPSVYSPLVGNEPSTVPGGYPSLAGAPEGQPLLPQAKPIQDLPLYGTASDARGGYYANPPIATISPTTPVQILDPSVGSDGLVQVSIGEFVGYVDGSLLENASAPQPTAPAGAAPAPVQPQGGLAGLGGAVMGALGGAKDAAGAVVGSMLGAPGQESKPAETSLGMDPGAYDVVPANDGIGVQSTVDGSDRSWMEFMLDNDAYVSTDYKGPPTANMSYQVGHGATADNHAAYDISCVSGNCSGKPVASPVTGKVVCSGYGQGTGESLAGCTYSQNTTYPGSAHTVVVQVGTTPEGQPIQLSFNHVGASTLKPGQTLSVGDQLGTIGDTDGGPHIHVEGWVGDPTNGYTLVDPQLVVGGYYGPVDSVAVDGTIPNLSPNASSLRQGRYRPTLRPDVSWHLEDRWTISTTTVMNIPAPPPSSSAWTATASLPQPTAIDEPDEQTAEPADAADESDAEDDDLSPEERVAAVLAQDADESGEEPDPAEAADAEADPLDLASLTPEQLRELAEEALRKREEAATADVDADQAAFEEEIAAYDQQTVGRVQAAFQREILDVSEAHYGRLLDEAITALDEEAERQTDLDPREYKRRHMAARRSPILRAQRAYEQKKAAEWEPVIEAEVTRARKQHPGLRQRYAELLRPRSTVCPSGPSRKSSKSRTPTTCRALPTRWTSRVRAHADSKKPKTSNSNANKRREPPIAAPVTAPATGRPKGSKPVALKGDEHEWLALTGKSAKRALQQI